ncbi:MAG: hypothetical protein WD314_08305 [Trueperaceae bacterium]
MARPKRQEQLTLQLLLERHGTGSLAQVQAALAYACEKAVQLFDSEDEKLALRGIHALTQAAGQYARVYEVAELGERVELLERQLGIAEGHSARPN